MTNITVPSKYPTHLEKFFKEMAPPPKANLIFAIDATASRQETWDMASELTTQMFRATAGSGLEMQLVYFRGPRECIASRWMSDPGALATAMSKIMCRSGFTQIGRVLAHVEKEDQRQKIAAAILISDSCEENPSDLYAAARKLNNVPVFMFQDGNDEKTAAIYAEIASITKGASCRFDAGAAARLADLLKAVVAFATGGRQALANQNTEAARLLLAKLK